MAKIGDTCEKCGSGNILPSGVCDHCNFPSGFPAVTKYLTGVYWVREHAYGGMTETTNEEIPAQREKHKQLGFDKPGISEIHTIKTTRQRIA